MLLVVIYLLLMLSVYRFFITSPLGVAVDLLSIEEGLFTQFSNVCPYECTCTSVVGSG